MEDLQALYNSEINFSISTEWDAGFTAKIGDEYNGYGLTEATFPTLLEAVEYIKALARKMYPDSKFAALTAQLPPTPKEGDNNE